MVPNQASAMMATKKVGVLLTIVVTVCLCVRAAELEPRHDGKLWLEMDWDERNAFDFGYNDCDVDVLGNPGWPKVEDLEREIFEYYYYRPRESRLQVPIRVVMKQKLARHRNDPPSKKRSKAEDDDGEVWPEKHGFLDGDYWGLEQERGIQFAFVRGQIECYNHEPRSTKAVADAAGNWVTAANAATTITITAPGVDGTAELPSRNGVIPAALDKFSVVSDRIYGSAASSPTIYRSGSALDERSGDFVGRPEQSWAANDIESFPTAEAVTCIAEMENELFVATQNDCAVLSDVLGALLWRGPWNIGAAGKRAQAETPYGLYWITGDKQLATFKEGVPTVISSEYERALLSQVGGAFLAQTECSYFRDPSSGADVLVIKARDANGNPLQVLHDFSLADERSEGGQGYESIYVGQLASDYTLVSVRDANREGRLWAGAANGQFYQLFDGANDGGAEFTADYIALLNCGQERLSIPWLDWVGDQKVQVAVGKTLRTSLATGSPFNPEVLVAAEAAEAVSGEENNFQYRAKLKNPECNHVYLRFQLTSHSVDGSLTLNSPPHMPIEDYGRIYAIYPALGAGRSR